MPRLVVVMRVAVPAFAFALGAGCAHNLPHDSPAQAERAGPLGGARPPGFLGEGWASFYGPGLRGHLTASGEAFDPRQLTAAHRALPFGTCVRVVNLNNGLAVQVRINDRGPYAGHRLIDLSQAAAQKLRILAEGVARVRLLSCATTQ